MTIAFSFEGVTPGERRRQTVEVDGQPVFVTMLIRAAPQVGVYRAIIPMEPDLVAALTAGNQMTAQIGDSRVGLHLAASSAALDVMSRLC